MLPSENLFQVIQPGMENGIMMRVRKDNTYCEHTIVI